jgi:hypothetical protein
MRLPAYVPSPLTRLACHKDSVSAFCSRSRTVLTCTAGQTSNRQSRRALLRAAALAAAVVTVSPLATSTAANASSASPILSLSAPTVAEESLRHSILYELASGSLLPVSSLQHVLDRAQSQSRCFILGEVHDEVETHAAQLAALQVLQAMDGNRRPLVVAFEQFYRSDTPALLAYVDGKIGLDTLLKKTKFANNWGYSASLYVPILHFCRAYKVRMVGMNVPSQVVSLVSRVGLDAIPPELRKLLPEIDLRQEAHLKHFMDAMGFAHGVSGSESRIMRYYEGENTGIRTRI